MDSSHRPRPRCPRTEGRLRKYVEGQQKYDVKTPDRVGDITDHHRSPPIAKNVQWGFDWQCSQITATSLLIVSDKKFQDATRCTKLSPPIEEHSGIMLTELAINARARMPCFATSARPLPPSTLRKIGSRIHEHVYVSLDKMESQSPYSKLQWLLFSTMV